ncbi:hypothetical protein [Schleiferilactobacillus harbinensis]|uniref:Uncharacterized protein n=1 Tax=Schleiferilactobacillus harbinensis TaxID=304207 RepID=A0A5P8M114_9LACO|nr:hypothetical protein [Schleiferilactobacillus harbinensis]QFR22180.1 hypothetical protein D1010_01240 [Schleiferilactobacillus harbinensis]
MKSPQHGNFPQHFRYVLVLIGTLELIGGWFLISDNAYMLLWGATSFVGVLLLQVTILSAKQKNNLIFIKKQIVRLLVFMWGIVAISFLQKNVRFTPIILLAIIGTLSWLAQVQLLRRSTRN